jgi:hypothetical protein
VARRVKVLEISTFYIIDLKIAYRGSCTVFPGIGCHPLLLFVPRTLNAKMH